MSDNRIPVTIVSLRTFREIGHDRLMPFGANEGVYVWYGRSNEHGRLSQLVRTGNPPEDQFDMAVSEPMRNTQSAFMRARKGFTPVFIMSDEPVLFEGCV